MGSGPWNAAPASLRVGTSIALSFVSCTEIQSQIPQQSSERPPGPSRCVAGADVLLRRGDGRGRAAAGPRGRRLLVPTTAAAAPPGGGDRREHGGGGPPLLPDGGGVRAAHGCRRRCRRRGVGAAAPQLCDTGQDLLNEVGPG